MILFRVVNILTQEVRLWEITEGDDLREIVHSKLNFEERIENWLEKDISIISKELMVIGRQIETGFGGSIDLLCLEFGGDVVIVELKRDKTPREITAQALDYASWVEELSSESIAEIGNAYFKNNITIEEAYSEKFGEEYPEVVNESHKMLIVASEIDNSSERIIKYLSGSYGVGINAITFNYFQNSDGKEYLSRVFLIEPSEVEYKTRIKGDTKKTKPLTFEESQKLAEERGVGEIYTKALEGFSEYFTQMSRHASGVTLYHRVEEDQPKKAFMALYSKYSNKDDGLNVNVYLDRISNSFNIDKDILIEGFPAFEKIEYKSYAEGEIAKVFFNSVEQVERVLSLFEENQ